MSEHRHRKIAAMQKPRSNFVAQTIAQMSAAVQRDHRADVAVKVRELAQHRHPGVEVIGIESAALGGAMHRDHRHTALQGKAKQPRIGQRRIDHRHGMFASGMRKKGQARLRHSLPELPVTPVGKIDVLTVRQTLHQHRAAFEATLQLVERISPGWMNRNARQKLGKSFRQPKHDMVRHEHGAEIFSRSSIRVVHPLMREKDHRLHRRFANQLLEMPGVDGFEIALERARRNAELAQHETGQPAVPARQSKPAARARDAIPHHVDVHVDASGAWRLRNSSNHQSGSVAFAGPRVHPLCKDAVLVGRRVLYRVNNMPTMHDSEKLFDECVRKCGGVRVTDIVGKAPPFKNADYYFENEGVVAELKSLQKDFLTAAETKHRMHLLFNKWVDDGRVSAPSGSFIIRTDDLPKDCAEELLDVFRIPLERVLREAERQILATKKALKCPNALGLLCLANDGNFALDPQMSVYLLKRCLGGGFPAIEHVILFSANLITNIKNAQEDAYLFASIRFVNRRQITDMFWEKLLSAWFAILEKAVGYSLIHRGPRMVSPEDISDSRFHPPNQL